MAHSIELCGELGRRLVVQVAGYENLDPETPDDASWLSCNVTLSTERFHGAIDTSFTIDDFARLKAELDQHLRGHAPAASFKPLEEVLVFDVALGATGRAAVRVELLDPLAVGNALKCSFETDAEALRNASAQLETVLSAFPTRAISLP